MVLSPLLRSALVLGLLSAVGPFAIDMFLPALPTIAEDLGATIGQTQGTITFYFVTFGLSQMVYGPWADQAGRKLPLYIGLVIFAIASVLATRAQSIEMLVAARAFQGMGAASLMVVTRAIVRDQYTGYEATKLMGLIMLVFSVSPMLAPLAGAGMIALTGWRAIFAAMAVAAVLAFAITALFQHETLPKSERKPINLATLGRGAKVLLRDPVFMGLTFGRRPGNVGLLHLHRLRLLRLCRDLRPHADPVLSGLHDQRHGLHRRLANRRAADAPLRRDADHPHGRNRLCRRDEHALCPVFSGLCELPRHRDRPDRGLCLRGSCDAHNHGRRP